MPVKTASSARVGASSLCWIRQLASTAFALASLTSVGISHAGPAMSWNLSRDIMLNATSGANPGGQWTFMSSSTLHQELTYQTLPHFDSPCGGLADLHCWRSAPGVNDPVVWVSDVTMPIANFVAEAGVPTMHPGPNDAVIVRWVSPVNGAVRVVGRFSDIDASCGNGIKWFLDKGNTTMLQGGLQDTGLGDGKAFSQVTTMASGESLYFIVSRGAAKDHNCDTTQLDVLITHQQ